MILTGMLFLLGLSSDISERKFILYFSLIPFTFFISTSIHILYGKPLNTTKKYTQYSLIALTIVLIVVFLDVIMDSPLSKQFNDMFSSSDDNNRSNFTNNFDIIIRPK